MIGFSDTQSCEGPGCDEWLTGRQARFCSPRCKMRAHRHEKAPRPAEKVCILCGATFRPLRGKQTYCDFTNDADETCAALQNERLSLARELEDTRWDKDCEHCGVNAGWDGAGRPRRFCSPRCKTAFYRAAKKNA
ncbi:hypothetical protein TPA0910_15570 [Streptomyces hygroscopicus subsp. sporocinereus]|uniref:Uncharacterized protein n=1 Tax=Streptomyces hygroscopicus TaxID=1912 RepID=A0ABQ3TUW7_STRHY|nr:hypothetical protein TPA0910_15570 [Streptomyces hygroscopicus]